MSFCLNVRNLVVKHEMQMYLHMSSCFIYIYVGFVLCLYNLVNQYATAIILTVATIMRHPPHTYNIIPQPGPSVVWNGRLVFAA